MRSCAARWRKGPGPYALQAAISSLHSLAPAYADTDWEQIAALYGAAGALRSLARGRAQPRRRRVLRRGPESALPLLEELTGPLGGLRAVPRGLCRLQRRLGDEAAARAAYERALELTGNPGERAFLARRRPGSPAMCSCDGSWGQTPGE